MFMSAPGSLKFTYTLHFFFLAVFQIPSGPENNGYPYTGNSAPSVSTVSIVSVEKAVQSVGLLYFYVSLSL